MFCRGYCIYCRSSDVSRQKKQQGAYNNKAKSSCTKEMASIWKERHCNWRWRNGLRNAFSVHARVPNDEPNTRPVTTSFFFLFSSFIFHCLTSYLSSLFLDLSPFPSFFSISNSKAFSYTFNVTWLVILVVNCVCAALAVHFAQSLFCTVGPSRVLRFHCTLRCSCARCCPSVRGGAVSTSMPWHPRRSLGHPSCRRSLCHLVLEGFARHSLMLWFRTLRRVLVPTLIRLVFRPFKTLRLARCASSPSSWFRQFWTSPSRACGTSCFIERDVIEAARPLS